MAITYNLTIGSLNRKLSLDGLENVIYEVSVGVNAQSQGYSQFTYSCGGTIQFDTSEINEESFVPFEEVTQETVIGWLLAKEGVESLDEFSYVKSSVDNIQARIDALQVEDTVSVGWTVTNAPVVSVAEEEISAEETQETVLES